jgi:hypothetical protein
MTPIKCAAQVLLDGNFLHAIAQLKYENLEGIISALLGGKVRLFVPSCAVRELRELVKDDKEFKAAAALARSFVRHKDKCPPSQANSECLLKQVSAPFCAPSAQLRSCAICYQGSAATQHGSHECKHIRDQSLKFTDACRRQSLAALVAGNAGQDHPHGSAEGALWPLRMLKSTHEPPPQPRDCHGLPSEAVRSTCELPCMPYANGAQPPRSHVDIAPGAAPRGAHHLRQFERRTPHGAARRSQSLGAAAGAAADARPGS